MVQIRVNVNVESTTVNSTLWYIYNAFVPRRIVSAWILEADNWGYNECLPCSERTCSSFQMTFADSSLYNDHYTTTTPSSYVNELNGEISPTPLTIPFLEHLKFQAAAWSPTKESHEVLKEYECLLDHVRKIKRSALLASAESNEVYVLLDLFLVVHLPRPERAANRFITPMHGI